MRHRSAVILCTAALVGWVACAGEADSAREAGSAAEEIVLGPVDGHDLPGTDLERVSAGDLAPDFTAMSSGGEPITLSGYRGQKNVVLFFYRGHW